MLEATKVTSTGVHAGDPGTAGNPIAKHGLKPGDRFTPYEKVSGKTGIVTEKPSDTIINKNPPNAETAYKGLKPGEKFPIPAKKPLPNFAPAKEAAK